MCIRDRDPSLVKSSLIKLFKEPSKTRFASREEPLEVEAVAPNQIVAEREKACQSGKNEVKKGVVRLSAKGLT